jgi:hypothetical protein
MNFHLFFSKIEEYLSNEICIIEQKLLEIKEKQIEQPIKYIKKS